MASMIDWDVALSTATRLVKPGPATTREAAAQTVAELRAAAVRAEAYVVEVTGLAVPSATAPVLVVDRPGWIQANLDGFRQVLAPLGDRAAEALQPGAVAGAVSARVTGAEVGLLLSYLSPKVLGQFDPFHPGGASASGPGGRLLLVAPNVVAVERELGVVPADFRLWVCLHEETHRAQFTAVPWLRDHLNRQIEQVVDSADLEPGALWQLVSTGVRRLARATRTGEEVSAVDLLQTPEQREIVDRITAVMSLLEGHADVVMDSVGPSVVPTVAEIRRRFTVRRESQGADRLVRRLLGLDAKMRQYRDGARFCRAVIDRVGMTGLNQVWSDPTALPSRAEIAQPELWLRRVAAAA